MLRVFRMTCAAVMAVAALPALAQTSSRPSIADLFSLENFGIVTLHSMLASARVLADIRYDQLSVDPVALLLEGLDLGEPLLEPVVHGDHVLERTCGVDDDLAVLDEQLEELLVLRDQADHEKPPVVDGRGNEAADTALIRCRSR